MTTFSHSTEEAGGLKTFIKRNSSHLHHLKEKKNSARTGLKSHTCDKCKREDKEESASCTGGFTNRISDSYLTILKCRENSLWLYLCDVLSDFLCGLSSLLTNIQYSILTRQWQKQRPQSYVNLYSSLILSSAGVYTQDSRHQIQSRLRVIGSSGKLKNSSMTVYLRQVRCRSESAQTTSFSPNTIFLKY